jgi:hypothetical protein
MVGLYHGRQIPWDEYHGVPAGWHMADILAMHARLDGRFPIAPGSYPGSNGRRSALPGHAWVEYRATLYGVAEGLLVDDPACVEIALRYIALRHIGSYSGFLRSLLARRLRHATRSVDQDDRLNGHFALLVARGERCQEFSDYLSLWRLLLTEHRLRQLHALLERHGASEAQAAWIHAALRIDGLLRSLRSG